MIVPNEPPVTPEWSNPGPRCGCPGDCSVCVPEVRIPPGVVLGEN